MLNSHAEFLTVCFPSPLNTPTPQLCFGSSALTAFGQGSKVAPLPRLEQEELMTLGLSTASPKLTGGRQGCQNKNHGRLVQ